ncbi:single-stranded DNA-binding protein [Paenibacillus melissococcoides]|uniref:Single-stranded DNA-binding protein n=1 Tax=Paenibacillus melissococcoides TaxID=2912268 RepID=A0ABM9G7W7_9BACL|nr:MULTISPECIES: single-stranded DNA-binding protein [Paenibacillus]MEB9893633.1 single-stranded DNA-binding protein [Bacillus cereus]CAH8247718.1 single-stranded DNA-binding protein [Paenibacillus melissococcoides]CAH8705758.1 single-stranded DNA-binding protein [Paenibacillus melissococcoides]CAH8715231.1 single-stranded DNA-binding protein [Paenibacillus melissococcoides]GIO80349.1 single-stranded DNA-binding protein [Paenibacillus dendritiformis]
MLNRVILIGRLTRDPELRYTPSGVAVTQFTLAVDRPFSNQNGEREADFIPVVTWRQLAETCANYLRKGRLTAVEGRIQVRSYDNNEGKRVYVTEVIADNVRFLESNRDSGGRRDDMGGGYGGGQPNNNSRPYGGGGSSQSRGPAADPFSDDGRPIDISDDDLPF